VIQWFLTIIFRVNSSTLCFSKELSPNMCMDVL
jgi:hypothetical protein